MMAEEFDSLLEHLALRVKKVRRWLVGLAALKVTALCLAFFACYFGVYAWLDHRFNFGTPGRTVALVLLGAGILYIGIRAGKLLLGHISCSRAANYIESKRNFNQELVTAIEYFENRKDYPYSHGLAEQVVLQTCRDSQRVNFGATVNKGAAYALMVFIIFALTVCGYFVHEHYVYFSSYFSRLVQPTAPVEPLPATILEAITGDVVVEPNTTAYMAAGIKGRVPETGSLILRNRDGEEDVDSNSESFELSPSFDANEQARLEMRLTLSEPAKMKYRFEADKTYSGWRKLTVSSIPKIKSIKAVVSIGKDSEFEGYSEIVENYNLEVPVESFVSVKVTATERLCAATIEGVDGKVQEKRLSDVNEFGFRFIADRDGFIRFRLTSSEGVLNEDIPPLCVRIKPDEQPAFRLISPKGDYAATNVASVPITFEVTDDFGLEEAELFVESAGAEAEVFDFGMEKGVRRASYGHTLELEEYDLSRGDSILFYCKAKDIGVYSEWSRYPVSSDVYFIEIRPYRRLWHQTKSGLPGGAGKQGLKGDAKKQHTKLSKILEYTRAILKKTWALADKRHLESEDREQLKSIADDVEYCQEQLELIVDDPSYNFSEEDKEILNKVFDNYVKADKFLRWFKAKEALPPEKAAYRILRKFLVELEKVLRKGGKGSLPPEPDRVKVEERVHLSRYEKERIEWELKKLSEKLSELAAEEERLKKNFETFLKQQAQQKLKQELTDEESWVSKSERRDACRPCPEGEGETGVPMTSKVSVEGALSPSPNGVSKAGEGEMGAASGSGGQKELEKLQKQQKALQAQINKLEKMLEQNSGGEGQKGDGRNKKETDEVRKKLAAFEEKNRELAQKMADIQKGKNEQARSNTKTGGNEQGKGSGYASSANAEQRLKMFQAKQRALEEKLHELREALRELPRIPNDEASKRREEAHRHLHAAGELMKEFQEKMHQAYFESEAENKMAEATKALDIAGEQLEIARKILENELPLTEEEKASKYAAEVAKELGELAEKFEADETVGKEELNQMIARLEEADALLAKAKPVKTGEGKKGKAQSNNASMQTSDGVGGRATLGSGKYAGGETAAETARILAREFWSISIKAKKLEAAVVEEEPSDARYFRVESGFFEEAAKTAKAGGQ